MGPMGPTAPLITPAQHADRGPGGMSPALKHSWLLPLQGLDHLLFLAEGGERTLLALHLTAER